MAGAFAVVCGLIAAGCSRAHYRKQADCVVTDIVGGATANPEYMLPNFGIEIDPRSRIHDPTDADRPPRPPDDPDAHRLMECVDGHRGWPWWDKDGVLDDFELTDFQPSLPYDKDGKVSVGLRETLQIARLHSRDYQNQLESLYMSALDVSAERFAFQTQWYGGNTTSYLGIGKLFPGGPSSTIQTVTNPNFTRAFATGGTLAAGLANSIVWQFSGNRSTTNFSLLNFALTQPLLQFAGRPRVLERLTLTERNLLENVRQYGRYRQNFYLTVATGVANQTNVQRIGGLGGGSGLTGFQGVGVNGFGTLGAVNNLSSLIGGGGGGIAPSGLGGYLGFLQQQQNFRNIRMQNSQAREVWLQLSAAFDAGRLDNRYQVEFARTFYYGGLSQLLVALNAYETSLDAYKISTLGLPPNVRFELTDPFFETFNLIDPDMIQLQDEVGDRLEELSSAQISGSDAMPSQSIKNLSERVHEFLDETDLAMTIVERELPKRRQALLDLAEFPELKENHFDNRALTPEALEKQFEMMRKEFPRVSSNLSQTVKLNQDLLADQGLEREARIRAEKEVLTRLSSSLWELSLVQARARLHRINFVPVKLTEDAAVQVALANRPDWMNAKASLVDTWRLIRYNANALRTNLTVNMSGNLGTSGNNPIQFNGENGTITAGVTVDPPLTRVLERNTFRISLINYQQQRRGLIMARDQIRQDIRGRLRQVRFNNLNLELRRLAVDVAITQMDVARLKLVEPERPVADATKAATASSPTLARDLTDALNSMVNQQQALINTFGDYENQRRLIDFSLGTMRLDDDGMWIDPGAITDDSIMARYYEMCPDPLQSNGNNGDYFQLAPGELPPEPSEMGLSEPIDTPSPSPN